MPYEFLVGWRYLYRRKRSAPLVRALIASIALGIGGTLLFFGTEWQAGAAVFMAIGAIGTAAFSLATVFTAFTTISMLGLAFGVATLIWVLAVTSGFYDEFRRKVLGVNAHVIVLKYGVDFSEYRQVIDTAEAVPGIVAAAPFAFNEMMIAKGNSLSGVLVKGVDPARVGRVLDLPTHIKDAVFGPESTIPQLLGPAGGGGGTHKVAVPGVIIGRELADKLDARVGDPVRLISPLNNLDSLGWWAGQVELPRSRDFRVVAIFDSGFAEYDKRLVYVNLREAQAFFDQGDVVTGVELKIKNVFAAKQTAKRLSQALEGGIYRTVDWGELNRNLFTALQTQKLVLQLLIGFMVIVAAFNVLAALAVLVIRKTREIAILKSMGMSASGIARVFESAGLVVWFVGTGIGLLWGYFGAIALRHYRFPLDPKVYLISELPVLLNPMEFVVTAFFALIVCIVATSYPAMRAARLDPVRGLRFQ